MTTKNVSRPEDANLIQEAWIDTHEAARLLRISEAALRNLTSQGKVPYYKFGRRNRYLASELSQLLLAQKRGPVAEPQTEF